MDTCVGCLEVVIVYGVGGLDDVAFVGDVYGLAFCGWKCSQCDSHHCRASRSSWRAFESCWLVMGVVNDCVVGKKFYS